MRTPQKPLSRRDFTILSLAWRISVILKSPGLVERDLLTGLYIALTTANPSGTLVYLQQQGFIQICGRIIRLANLEKYNTALLNGIDIEQVLPTAKLIARNWNSGARDLLRKPAAKPRPKKRQQTTPSTKKRKRTKPVIKTDLTVLDRLNINQVLTDFAAAISIRKQKSIPAYMALWVIKRLCTEGQDPDKVLQALKSKQLIAKRLNGDQQVYWYLIRHGKELLSNNPCSPNFTELEQEKIAAGSVFI